MLRVRTATDVGVRVLIQRLAQFAGDLRKIGQNAIVHEGVPAKDERVVVHAGDGGGGGGADMCETGGRGGVGADGAEVGIV